MKYIIDIEEKPFKKGDNELYKCKQFNSLVFDRNGLGKLLAYKPQQDATIDNAQNEAWKLMQEVVRLRFTPQWNEVFPEKSLSNVLVGNSYKQVKAIMDKINGKKAKSIYNRGQEWETESGNRVVIMEDLDASTYLVLAQNGNIVKMESAHLKKPTNRSYPHFGEMVFAMNNP